MDSLGRHAMTPTPSTQIDVVIVEDDALIAAVITAALESAGLSVAQCPPGTQAFRCLRRKRPRLLILDVLMPEVNGAQIFEAMRLIPATAAIPVIFCTAAPSRLREM